MVGILSAVNLLVSKIREFGMGLDCYSIDGVDVLADWNEANRAKMGKYVDSII